MNRIKRLIGKWQLMILLCVSFTATCVMAANEPPSSQPNAAKPAAANIKEEVRTVQEIKFTGNKKVLTETLAKQLPLKVGDVNTKEAIRAAANKILEVYKQANVNLSFYVDINLPDASHTVVNFLIDENGTEGFKGAAPRDNGNKAEPAPVAK